MTIKQSLVWGALGLSVLTTGCEVNTPTQPDSEIICEYDDQTALVSELQEENTALTEQLASFTTGIPNGTYEFIKVEREQNRNPGGYTQDDIKGYIKFNNDNTYIISYEWIFDNIEKTEKGNFSVFGNKIRFDPDRFSWSRDGSFNWDKETGFLTLSLGRHNSWIDVNIDQEGHKNWGIRWTFEKVIK